MKRDKHYEKPIEIIKFLTNKYFHFSGIKEVDFIELKLAYSRVLHVENKFFVMVYESSQKRAKTLAEVSEGLAIIKKNLKNRAVDDFLSVLKVVTEKNEPIFCFEMLKKMNIDMSYCAELALYAKINSNVGNESDFVNKINKI